ncbi:MAG TPA: hypothetical protein VNI84_08690 [Pyrinomonadaceae bacterium]|nr:hypothetical protein [Pyrinomonadaceae bacterium]
MDIENTENKETAILYDADASQRFAFDVIERGEKFETAHRFHPLSDEKYLDYVKAINARADEDDSESNESEVLANLWRELVQEVENLEVEEGRDFRDAVDAESEIVPSIKNFLVVAVVETEKIGTGKRKGTAAVSTETVTTEAYFNGAAVLQTHVLKSKKSNDEFSKKHARIEKNQWKTEITKGLRRQPKVEFHPQDAAKAALYDEMLERSEGFKDGKTPIRFKSVVVDYVFAAVALDPKK